MSLPSLCPGSSSLPAAVRLWGRSWRFGEQPASQVGGAGSCVGGAGVTVVCLLKV